MRVMIERNDVRAARGGVGFAKTGGNYAAAMRSTSAAMREGFTVALWLDPVERSAIEELSGMNIFAVIDGELQTPALSDSILPGITRDCVISLARSHGLVVSEKIMPIAELLTAIRAGHCREVFASGTAAIVTPVSELGDSDGQIYVLPDSHIALKLRSALLDIQERRAPDRLSWTCDIPLEHGATR
jgi:branched-chain amino acid aminotransferase